MKWWIYVKATRTINGIYEAPYIPYRKVRKNNSGKKGY